MARIGFALVACGGADTPAGNDGGQQDFAHDSMTGSPPAGAKRVFVTKGTFTADLKSAGSAATGLAGADKLCSNAASAAGLGGSWKAWLSDSTTDAISRIADVGPWYRIDGSSVFKNKDAFSSNPSVAINRTESGELLGSDPPPTSASLASIIVWTATANFLALPPATPSQFFVAAGWFLRRARRQASDIASPPLAPSVHSHPAMRFLLALGFLSLCLAGCNDDGLSPSTGKSDLGTQDAAIVACNTLRSQAECSTRPDCKSFTCSGCSPNDPLFACVDGHDNVPHSCPKIACPEPCSQHTSEASCSADPSCFSIYNDGMLCACPVAGCCMMFERCRPRPATCCSADFCDWAPPCGPGFVSVYESACGTGCATGCVKAEVCFAD